MVDPAAAYPAHYTGKVLHKLAQTVLTDLVDMVVPGKLVDCEDTQLRFYGNISGTVLDDEIYGYVCPDTILLDLRNTTFGILEPFMKAATFTSTVPPAPTLPGDPNPESFEWIHYDDLSAFQLASIGFETTAQWEEALTEACPTFSQETPFDVLTVTVASPDTLISYPGPLPVRVHPGDGEPLRPLTGFPTAGNPITNVTIIDDLFTAELTLPLSCGCTTKTNVIGTSSPYYPDSNVLHQPGLYSNVLAAGHLYASTVTKTVTVDAHTQTTPEPPKYNLQTPPHGIAQLTGRVTNESIFVNKYTHNTFRIIHTVIPVRCQHFIHQITFTDDDPRWTDLLDGINIIICYADSTQSLPRLKKGDLISAEGTLCLTGHSYEENECEHLHT